MTYIPINKGNYILETPERIKQFERNRGSGCEDAYAENRKNWSKYPRKRFLSDYPLHVDLELASVCNLRCPMCYTITDEFKKRINAKLMDFELYKTLIDQCAEGGVYSVRLSFRGESFLHKNIVDCIRYAKDQGIKEVSSLTNGLRLDEKMFTEVMEAGIDWLTISIDGIGETYDKIRKPSKFERMVEKLTNFKEIKREAGSVKPVIKVQSIFPAIADDPKTFYDIFMPITDQVATNPLIDYLRLDESNSILYHEDFECPQIYQRLVIAADGLALLCSNDEQNEYVVGDANSESIHQIWHGQPLTEAREHHRNLQGCNKIVPCQHCYLPRKTEPTQIRMGDTTHTIDNYVNRSQKIGS